MATAMATASSNMWRVDSTALAVFVEGFLRHHILLEINEVSDNPWFFGATAPDCIAMFMEKNDEYLLELGESFGPWPVILASDS